jgi:ATP-dependent DNA helicase RecG
MTEQCSLAKLPPPIITNEGSDFLIVFRKDIYNKEDLSKLGLSERQIKAVLYVKEKGKITNSEYQKINSVSKPTATRDLTELTDTYKILKNTGFGAGSVYELVT